jgi:hypothetical protein
MPERNKEKQNIPNLCSIRPLLTYNNAKGPRQKTISQKESELCFTETIFSIFLRKFDLGISSITPP